MQKLFWFYRDTFSKKNTVKKSEIPEDWKKDDEKTKHKVCQKDTDARWTKKRGETYFGYKNHVQADVDSMIITDYSVIDAAVHDSKRLFTTEGVTFTVDQRASKLFGIRSASLSKILRRLQLTGSSVAATAALKEHKSSSIARAHMTADNSCL